MSDLYFCQHCKQEVVSTEVTFDERHDQRAGGCGNPLLVEAPIEHLDRITALESENLSLREENARLKEHVQQWKRLALTADEEVTKLRSDLSAVMADKERLDWLEDQIGLDHETLHLSTAVNGGDECWHKKEIRQAIDSAKGQQS